MRHNALHHHTVIQRNCPYFVHHYISLPESRTCSYWLPAQEVNADTHAILQTYKELQDQQQCCREMKDNTHLVEFDYVGVVQQLHYLHLSVNFLEVGRVQSGLVNYLNGHLQKQRPHLKWNKIPRLNILEKNANAVKREKSC